VVAQLGYGAHFQAHANSKITVNKGIGSKQPELPLYLTVSFLGFLDFS